MPTILPSTPCRAAVQDPGVDLRYIQADDPSRTSRSDSYGCRRLTENLARYYPELVHIHSISVSATDARHY